MDFSYLRTSCFCKVRRHFSPTNKVTFTSTVTVESCSCIYAVILRNRYSISPAIKEFLNAKINRSRRLYLFLHQVTYSDKVKSKKKNGQSSVASIRKRVEKSLILRGFHHSYFVLWGRREGESNECFRPYMLWFSLYFPILFYIAIGSLDTIECQSVKNHCR